MRVLFHLIKTGGLLLGLIGLAIHLEAQVSPAADRLTNASQVRDLTADEAAQRLTVSLSGVIIDTGVAGPDRNLIILSDPTAEMYVLVLTNIQKDLAAYHPGDWLKVEGVTGSGQFAPIVLAKSVQKMGTAAIPAAKPATYQELITGALDAQWVEVKGVVRQYVKTGAKSDFGRITIATGGGTVQARFVTSTGGLLQVDAEVTVHAVCLYQFNQKRQVLNPILQVPRETPVIVEKIAPVNPYAAPTRSVASLLTFSPENLHAYPHRVHVRGIVTCSQPGSFVWIHAGESGVRIQTRQQENLLPGDKIDVLGFPTFGADVPMLEDAVFQKTGATQPLSPLPLTNFTAAFDHEDDLVTMDGTLTQIQAVMDGVVFTLDKDAQIFKALLKASPGEPANMDWPIGGKVRITGICTLAHDETMPYAGIWQPKSFQILLRSRADFLIIKSPPWWTPEHVTFLLSVISGLLVLIISLVVMLSRRRLHEQKRRREMAEHEFTAILSERNRLAREIHDTLAQGLGAISMQLELVKGRLAPDVNGAGINLDQAHQLVRDSLADARNSIWNMRSQVLETGDLGSALTGVLQQLSGDTGVAGRMRVKGRSRRLPPVTENNLLRIGQEAITNAMKHAQPKLIEVELEFSDKEARLCVKDDGRGFDTARPPAGESGFGLMGMRERAEEMHGQLNVQSSAGRGTEITLAVPITG